MRKCPECITSMAEFDEETADTPPEETPVEDTPEETPTEKEETAEVLS